MRIIDARSGKEVRVGDVVDYGLPPPFVIWYDGRDDHIGPDGIPVIGTGPGVRMPNPHRHREWWRLLKVRDRLFTAQALIEYHGSDGSVTTSWGPLRVRVTHPSFFGQRVAFVPT